jgi:hypothetical protein
MKNVLLFISSKVRNTLFAVLSAALVMLLIGDTIKAQQIINPTVNAFSSENGASLTITVDGGSRDQTAAATVDG